MEAVNNAETSLDDNRDGLRNENGSIIIKSSDINDSNDDESYSFDSLT